MIGLDREGWILAGFVVLFVSAIVVSACGCLLLWRTRPPSRAEPVRAARPVAPPEDEPEGPPPEEAAPVLPPGNPLR